MYAVIRTGGKQYRVAPGDVVKIEKAGGDTNKRGGVQRRAGLYRWTFAHRQADRCRRCGHRCQRGTGDKILVFHFKRKKQYKKLQGHRQAYTEIRINSIEVNGFSYGSEKGQSKISDRG
jgi:large subunit ribosomal protein L21